MTTNSATKANVRNRPAVTEEKRSEVVADKPKAYDPTSDSTPAHKARAAETGRLVLELTDGACLCGCMGEAASRFLPGHDAKLKGKLTRAAIADVGLTVIFGEEATNSDVKQFAKVLSTQKFDWVAAIETAIEKAKTHEAEKAERAKAAAKRAEERKTVASEKGKGKISLDDFVGAGAK